MKKNTEKEKQQNVKKKFKRTRTDIIYSWLTWNTQL